MARKATWCGFTTDYYYCTLQLKNLVFASDYCECRQSMYFYNIIYVSTYTGTYLLLLGRQHNYTCKGWMMVWSCRAPMFSDDILLGADEPTRTPNTDGDTTNCIHNVMHLHKHQLEYTTTNIGLQAY
jgi:hypothetical protein